MFLTIAELIVLIGPAYVLAGWLIFDRHWLVNRIDEIGDNFDLYCTDADRRFELVEGRMGILERWARQAIGGPPRATPADVVALLAPIAAEITTTRIDTGPETAPIRIPCDTVPTHVAIGKWQAEQQAFFEQAMARISEAGK